MGRNVTGGVQNECSRLAFGLLGSFKSALGEEIIAEAWGSRLDYSLVELARIFLQNRFG